MSTQSFDIKDLVGNRSTKPQKNQQPTKTVQAQDANTKDTHEEVTEVTKKTNSVAEVVVTQSNKNTAKEGHVEVIGDVFEQDNPTDNTSKKKKRVGKTTATNDYLPPEYDDAPTGVRQIARPDLPSSYYGVSPAKSNFDLYNEDLEFKIMPQVFSKGNVRNGGVSINKSQLIETCLDFVFYDIGLTPKGFTSTEDMRNYLRSFLKEK